jgi:hypothetical protein
MKLWKSARRWPTTLPIRRSPPTLQPRVLLLSPTTVAWPDDACSQVYCMFGFDDEQEFEAKRESGFLREVLSAPLIVLRWLDARRRSVDGALSRR